MPFSLVLLLGLALPQMAPDAPKPDALALLNEVSQRYAEVKSYHIEAIEEETSGNELQHSWAEDNAYGGSSRQVDVIATKGARATARQLLCQMAQRSGPTTYMTISIPNTLRLPNTQRGAALFRTKKHRR